MKKLVLFGFLSLGSALVSADILPERALISIEESNDATHFLLTDIEETFAQVDTREINFQLPYGQSFTGKLVATKNLVPGVVTRIYRDAHGDKITVSHRGNVFSGLVTAKGQQWRFNSANGISTLRRVSAHDKSGIVSDIMDSTQLPNSGRLTNRMLRKDNQGTEIEGNSILDMYAVLDSNANQDFGGDVGVEFAQHVAWANEAFERSGVDIRIRVSQLHQFEFSEEVTLVDSLDELLYDDEGQYHYLAATDSGADLFHHTVRYSRSNDICGLGSLSGADGNFPSAPVPSMMGMACASRGMRTLVHEVGHGLGLNHSRRQDGFGYAYPYAVGYGVDYEFVTIMAYAREFGNAEALPLFSSPDLDCKGQPCGIEASEPEVDDGVSADSVKALNLNRKNASAIGSEPKDDFTDTIAGAEAIDSHQQGTLDYLGDIDTFKLVADSVQEYQFEFSTELLGHIYDSNGMRLYTSNGSSMSVSLPSGDYYIALSKLDREDVLDYSVTVEKLPAKPVTVSIGTRGEGRLLSIEDAISGNGCEFSEKNCQLETYEKMPLALQFIPDEYTRVTGIADCSAKRAWGCNPVATENLDVEIELIEYFDGIGNSRADSKPIPFSEIIDERIAHIHDNDVYRFSVNEERDVTLWMNYTDNVHAEVRSNDGSLVAERDFVDMDIKSKNDYKLSLGRLQPDNYYMTLNSLSEGVVSTRFFLADEDEMGTISIDYPNSISRGVQFGVNTYFDYEVSYGNEVDTLTVTAPIGAEVEMQLVMVDGYTYRFSSCERLSATHCVKKVTSALDFAKAEISEDADNNGLGDDWQNEFNETSPNNDADDDGLTAKQEFWFGTSPTSVDTDGDGLSDGDEVVGETKQLTPDANVDYDSDWLTNREELTGYRTSPNDSMSGTTGSDIERTVNDGSRLMMSHTESDYDGDGKGDHAFYDPANGNFYIESTGLRRNILQKTPLVYAVPVTGDIDGDNLTDVVVYSMRDKYWFVRHSESAATESIYFYDSYNSIPLLGDIDGDGRDDLILRNPFEGYWLVRKSTDLSAEKVFFGKQSTDIPLIEDMNGDGYDDFIIRRPTTGDWYVKDAVTGDITQWFLGREAGDIPFVMDFNGDGINEFAIRRPSNRNWFIKELASNDVTEIEFGQQITDIPAIYDVDGDGSDDLVIRRANESRFYWRPVFNYDGVDYSYFGKRTRYIPAAAPLMYRMPDVPWTSIDEQQAEVTTSPQVDP